VGIWRKRGAILHGGRELSTEGGGGFFSGPLNQAKVFTRSAGIFPEGG